MKINPEKIKKNIIIAVFWLVLVSSFLFFSFLIILRANGYQIDYGTWRLDKTGMIVINGQPRNVKIFLNNKEQPTGFPEKISALSPGTYDVLIESDGYHEWHKMIKIESGLAFVDNQITLFRQNPLSANVSQNLTVERLSQEYANLNPDIKFIDSEIFYKENLVTRFSQKVLAVGLHPDSKHIFFQVSDEVRVIEVDGTNNTLLFKLKSSEPTTIGFRDNGATILYIDEGKVSAKTLY